LASVFPFASYPPLASVLAPPLTSTFASVFPLTSGFFLPPSEEESDEVVSDPFLASVFPLASPPVLAPVFTSTFTPTFPPTFIPPLALPLASPFFPKSKLDPEDEGDFLALGFFRIRFF